MRTYRIWSSLTSLISKRYQPMWVYRTSTPESRSDGTGTHALTEGQLYPKSELHQPEKGICLSPLEVEQVTYGFALPNDP